jgi:ribosome recycling factor
MIEDLKKDAAARMQKAIEALKSVLVKLRTGRAHPSLLEGLTVDYYGTPTPLKQVAQINVVDARMLSVTPWEKTMVSPVEKAIISAGLGLNPVTAGTLIRVPLPPLTEERRRELTKVVRHEGENAKVAVRNVRRDVNQDLKEMLKEKMVSEDDERRAQEAVQKLTDQHIAEVDKVVAAKEAEILQV